MSDELGWVGVGVARRDERGRAWGLRVWWWW